MTADTAISGRVQIRPVQAIAAFGCSIVFLGLLAALASLLLGRAPLPDALRNWALIIHFVVVFAALPLTIVQFALPKGASLHRTIGYAWCGLLLVASLVSFGIHEINGGLSPPHYFAMASLVLVPTIPLLARQGWHMTHRGLVLAYVLFFLVSAGAITFTPGRVMGGLLFSLWN